MTAQPHPEQVPSIVPTRAHRVAAARAARLGAHCQTEDLLAFFDDLAYDERPHVFALLARTAGGRGVTPVEHVDPPWWTPDEVAQAERLWQDGNRSAWVRTGHDLYRKAQAQARQGIRPPQLAAVPTVTAIPKGRGSDWTADEDAAIMAHDRPRDSVLAERLGRSVNAVWSRRAYLRARS